MLQPVYAKQFDRDLKRLQRSGHHDIEKLKEIVRLLIDEHPLQIKHRDHSLTGKFKGRRECHIEPDWLLVYKVNMKAKVIVFERTGSHSDIFG
jgi:mRNA interferase YafQ